MLVTLWNITMGLCLQQRVETMIKVAGQTVLSRGKEHGRTTTASTQISMANTSKQMQHL